MSLEGIRCKKCDSFIRRKDGLHHIKTHHHWKLSDDYSFEEFFEVIVA